MVFVVDTFSESDKQDWLNLWDQADPWSKENNRPDIPESNWKEILSSEGSLHAFAIREGQDGGPVGYIIYRFNACIKTKDQECAILDVFVAPESRRQGGGTQLMQAVDGEARKKGAGRIFWASNPKRQEAMGFYAVFAPEGWSETAAFYQWYEKENKAVA